MAAIAKARSMLKRAEKARKDTQKTNDSYGKNLLDPEEAYEAYMRLEMEQALKEMRLACELEIAYREVRNEMGLNDKADKGRHTFLTIRPPNTVSWLVFYEKTQAFIEKWQNKWDWAEWCYEQKGTNEQNMGCGFHIHILIKTTATNYYKSHILRDAIRAFPEVAAHCIQADSIPAPRVEKCRQYIRGNKQTPEKLEAVPYDKIWRASMNLEEIYTKADGQVQSVC